MESLCDYCVFNNEDHGCCEIGEANSNWGRDESTQKTICVNCDNFKQDETKL